MDFKENGTLKQLIEKEIRHESPPNDDNTTKQIILCRIAHGMMILHSRPVIHRDLKPRIFFSILIFLFFLTLDWQNFITKKNCSSPARITLPPSVTSIGQSAFHICTNLPLEIRNYLIMPFGNPVIWYILFLG